MSCLMSYVKSGIMSNVVSNVAMSRFEAAQGFIEESARRLAVTGALCGALLLKVMGLSERASLLPPAVGMPCNCVGYCGHRISPCSV